MNIKEIEEISQIPRVNLRYYEKEGFLSPNKEGNKDREYSEKDLDILLKIKLLRHLGIPLDTIRQLQNKESILSDILEKRLEQQEEESQNMMLVREICTKIKNSNSNFQGLNAKSYLSIMKEKADLHDTYPVYEEDRIKNVNYPIRRFAARAVDFLLYAFLWEVISVLVFRIPLRAGIRVVDAFVPYGLLLILEPLLLSLLGYTPGKFIFGLKVRKPDGKKISVKDGIKRAFGVFGVGMGYAIPAYNVWRLYKSYTFCASGEDLEWEYDLNYSMKDTSILRYVGGAAFYALFFALSGIVIMQGNMPRHKGEITKAELVDNINDLSNYIKLYDKYTLDEQGNWIDETANDNTIVIVIDEFTLELPRVHMEEKDGRVVRAGFEVKMENTQSWIFDMAGVMNLLILGYGASDKEINCFSLNAGDYLLYNSKISPFESFSYSMGNKTVECIVEYEGYESMNNLLIHREGENNYFYFEFLITEKE